MRKFYIAGNWKMNKTVSESVELAKEVAAAVEVEVKNPTASTQKPHCQYTKTPVPAFPKNTTAGARGRVAAQSVYTLVSETRV